MNIRFLGDSYDLVKQSLLRCLAPLGSWAVCPMFTGDISVAEAEEFYHLIGAPLLSREPLHQKTDRSAYFASARRSSSHLFLDPDTGLRLKVTRGAKAPSYLFLAELVAIAGRRTDALTLVFDQSIPRGDEQEAVARKLDACASHGLHGVAYISHACFLLVAHDPEVLTRAFRTLRSESRLPEARFKVTNAA